MKKALSLAVFSAFLLAGCSQEAEPAVSAEEKSAEPAAYYEGYVKNPQVTDERELTEVGETMHDNRGEVELKAINADSQTVQIGEIELTIHESKLFHFQPDYSLIDFYHSYTHDTEFDVVKFFVEIKNTSEEPLNFAPVALLEAGENEMKLWEDDIYLEELNGEIKGGESKKGNIGFIIESPSAKSVKITTSDVFNANSEKVEDAQEIEIELN